MNTLPIDIAQIVTDANTQARADLDLPTVERYAGLLAEGVTLPPVVVFQGEDDVLRLADGFHRVAARRLLLSLLPNAAGEYVEVGGDRFRLADVVALDLDVVRAVVHEGEARDAFLYSATANETHGMPASRADRKHAAVAMLTDLEWGRWSDREIAKRCGIRSHSTVSKYRAELVGTGQIRQSDERIGADGRTINTAKIGEGSKVEAAPWAFGDRLELPCGGVVAVDQIGKSQYAEGYFVVIRAIKHAACVWAAGGVLAEERTLTVADVQLHSMLAGHHHRAMEAAKALAKRTGDDAHVQKDACLVAAEERPDWTTREIMEHVAPSLFGGEVREVEETDDSVPIAVSVEADAEPAVYTQAEIPFEEKTPNTSALEWNPTARRWEARCGFCSTMRPVVQRDPKWPVKIAVHFVGGKCPGSNFEVASRFPKTPMIDDQQDEDDQDIVEENADGTVKVSEGGGVPSLVEAAMAANEILKEAEASGDVRPVAYMAGVKGQERPSPEWGPVDVALYRRGLGVFDSLREAGLVQSVQDVEAADNGHKRDPLDRYYTPFEVVEAVISEVVAPLYAREAPTLALEPSVGGGVWARGLSSTFPEVAIHGVDADPDAAGLEDVLVPFTMTLEDFAGQHPKRAGQYDLVIGNPPNVLAEEFVRTCLDLLREGGYLVFVLPVSFMGSLTRRRGLHREHPPLGLWMLGRIQFEGPGMEDHAGGTGVHDQYAIVWRKGHDGPIAYGDLDWKARAEARATT